ncbi:MAG TPA: TolC family protein, partial [Vicinamibacteria bacterium]
MPLLFPPVLSVPLLSVTLISVAPEARAVPAPQTAETGAAEIRVTLTEALQRAHTASARLAQLRALETASGETLRGAQADRWPSLGLSGQYSRNSNVPEFVVPQPDGSQLVVFPNLPNQGYLRASVAQPLYTGGRVGGNLESAEAQQAAAAQDTKAAQADLRLEVTASFWNLRSRRESERVLREAIASYEAHLKDATNLLEVGMAARNDVLAVQVERDGAELSRLQAESAAEVENANLVRLLDLPPGSRVVPAEDAVDPGLGTEGRDLAEVEGFVAEALQQRSEVLALQSRVAAASAQAKVARAPSLPQASLQGMYDYANPSQRIFPLEGTWRDTWTVAVGVSFTPFDGGRSSAAAARAEAQAEAAGHQLRDLQQRVRLEVTSRFLELRAARASLEVATRNVTAAQENVRVSQDRYRAGVSPSSYLLDAETRLLHVDLERTQAAAHLQVARARLERARG